MKSIPEILAEELGQKLEYVQNVVNLMDEGNTIPFIARYRKEMHGAMDDTTLRNLETRLTYLRNLQERRDEVKKSIENQGKLTQELSDAIDSAATMAEVEDLYAPTSRNAAPAAPSPGKKGLRLWPRPFSLRTDKTPPCWPRAISTRKRASTPWRKPYRVPMTSLPKIFPTTPTSASLCGSW